MKIVKFTTAIKFYCIPFYCRDVKLFDLTAPCIVMKVGLQTINIKCIYLIIKPWYNVNINSKTWPVELFRNIVDN